VCRLIASRTPSADRDRAHDESGRPISGKHDHEISTRIEEEARTKRRHAEQQRAHWAPGHAGEDNASPFFAAKAEHIPVKMPRQDGWQNMAVIVKGGIDAMQGLVRSGGKGGQDRHRPMMVSTI